MRLSIFAYRVSATVLNDFRRSGRGIDLFLRIPGAMRTYRNLRVIEVNRKTAVLQAPDGSRRSVARQRILDPTKLRRSHEPQVGLLDVLDLDTFL